MKTLTIRGIDPVLSNAIKSLAMENQESINQMTLKILKDATGVSYKPVFRTFTDLDALAGTWSEDDEQQFNQAIECFNKIDPELWA